MKIINWNNDISKEELKEIDTCLKNKGLVIFPTETVYGLGANALDKDAVSKIFIAKGRAGDNPLIVHLSDKLVINKYAYIQNDMEQKLIDTFMPGPFTIILKKKDNIPDNVSAGLDTVGVRIPSNKIANRILDYVNIPIAAPSANVSGKPSGTNIKDIKDEFKDKVDYIIDGLDTDIGLESTVVKVVDNVPVILRPGFITKEDILDAVGEVKVSDNLFKKASGKVESPGMKYKHYAPDALVKLIYIKDKDEMINYFKDNASINTVIIGSSKLKDIKCKKYLYYGDTLDSISHNIFKLLREADMYTPDIILIEGVSKEGLGLAIMNRLIRAANYNYIEK